MIVLATIMDALRRLPRPLLLGMVAALGLLLLWRWHEARVADGFAAGATAQAAADRARIDTAISAAAAAQRDRIAALAKVQSHVSKGSEDALLARNDDLDRRYDDLRLRWAAYRAAEGGAGHDRAAPVPGPATGADDAACAAAGWVSFDTAAAAARAADTAIAKDDAWIAWIGKQAAAWPE